MSDPLTPTLSPASTTDIFDQSPRRALATMPDQDRNAWHLRYCSQEGAEPRVWVLLAKVEAEIRAAGEPATIHALWVHLADRAGQENNLDLQAAAALAGMAMGLRTS